MAKLVVKYREDGNKRYVNIKCDRVQERDGMILAWVGDGLVGAFDLGAIDIAYISEERT